jgi:glutathione synthase/RimK-type ligase-like ATP-grasp enzyme
VLHDNPAWLPPLLAALRARAVPHREHPLGAGTLDLAAPPPAGVFWSRFSASAHTRGRPWAKEHARAVLAWLDGHGRRVVNGREVLELEVSKIAQQAALAAFGIEVPRTVAVVGDDPDAVLAAADAVGYPLVTKHNQGGKGLGVRRADDPGELAAQLRDPARERPVDGILLVQEYLRAARPRITRVELVGGEVVYGLTADTSAGFELCPAEACAVPGGFALRPELPAELVGRYREFVRGHGIEVAGIEFIETADGRTVTYDVNTNTNYNPDVEAQARDAGLAGAADTLAGHLAGVLAASTQDGSRA